ncbi:hypothetical protein HNP37_001033 [Flavobacterium nitrogenifigens]|uniref:Uncharacterized protein n=2 Tax=Flavobacterium TaxID=237 RepID=A0A7W7IUW1_9FLAO|nr:MULTISPECIES: hypothetical protein [Flavobacterium]MBB4800994.1 hypothetical protein [Flavobacterium nitrogenifigens]MBB6385258.1 hypothetical protein [Flavobacterium notoginsengisoli]
MKEKIIKNLNIYFSEKHSQIIFAPTYRKPKIPIYFEQEICEVIDFESSNEIIGEALKRNFDKFDLKERKSITNNNSDWAVLNASKEKTKKAFDTNYQLINVRGANEFNIILIIETVLNYPHQIELTTSISASHESFELGKRILSIYNSEICKRKII